MNMYLIFIVFISRPTFLYHVIKSFYIFDEVARETNTLSLIYE
jgi:hypothetical protein